MIELVFNAPDLPTLANAAIAMGYYDPVAKKITATGSIATGGAYFLNMVGTVFDTNGTALPGIWGRLRHNGDPAKLPSLPTSSGITLYHFDPIIGWTSDGVTPGPSYIKDIGVIA